MYTTGVVCVQDVARVVVCQGCECISGDSLYRWVLSRAKGSGRSLWHQSCAGKDNGVDFVLIVGGWKEGVRTDFPYVSSMSQKVRRMAEYRSTTRPASQIHSTYIQ